MFAIVYHKLHHHVRVILEFLNGIVDLLITLSLLELTILEFLNGIVDLLITLSLLELTD